MSSQPHCTPPKHCPITLYSTAHGHTQIHTLSLVLLPSSHTPFVAASSAASFLASRLIFICSILVSGFPSGPTGTDLSAPGAPAPAGDGLPACGGPACGGPPAAPLSGAAAVEAPPAAFLASSAASFFSARWIFICSILFGGFPSGLAFGGAGLPDGAGVAGGGPAGSGVPAAAVGLGAGASPAADTAGAGAATAGEPGGGVLGGGPVGGGPVSAVEGGGTSPGAVTPPVPVPAGVDATFAARCFSSSSAASFFSSRLILLF